MQSMKVAALCIFACNAEHALACSETILFTLEKVANNICNNFSFLQYSMSVQELCIILVFHEE
jgi:hypothetical protein